MEGGVLVWAEDTVSVLEDDTEQNLSEAKGVTGVEGVI